MRRAGNAVETKHRGRAAARGRTRASSPATARHRSLRTLLLAGAGGLGLHVSAAHAADDLMTPRGVGMGYSLIADATGALGPLVNPAGMVLRKSYSIEAMYGFRVQDTGSNLLAAIVDSTTSRVAAGLYYAYVHSSPHFSWAGGGAADATRSGSETGVSLALPVGDVFALGLSAKYIRITTDAANPAYDATTNPSVPQRITLDSSNAPSNSSAGAPADGFTLDIGTSLKFGQAFSVGVVGYNLIPLRSVEAPISLGTGAAYHAGENVTLAADFIVNFNKFKAQTDAAPDIVTYRVGGGLEWLVAGKVALRAGTLWDGGRPGTYVTAGLAYVGQSFAVDAGYKQEVQGGKESLIVAGIRVFLQ